jgi:hypothetical protein
MGVRKFRSVEQMPTPPVRPPLDPENLRLALGLATFAQLHPVRHHPGVRKFRSWEELVAFREAHARRERKRLNGASF